jgi:phage terminase small subunit
LHALQGTLHSRHSRDRAGEPVPEGDLSPEPPPWFSEGQRESWNHAIRHAPRGLLKEIDGTVLALCIRRLDPTGIGS